MSIPACVACLDSLAPYMAFRKGFRRPHVNEPVNQSIRVTHLSIPSIDTDRLTLLIQFDLAIDLDARDPDFAASLRSIGPVVPNPTFSNSSTFNRQIPSQQGQRVAGGPSVFPDAANPALLVLSSRARIAKAAEEEAESFGRQSHAGREFLDVLTMRKVLSMRDRQGLSETEIERLLRLKKGVVGRLGRRGLVGEAG
jgi:hypothetical protein